MRILRLPSFQKAFAAVPIYGVGRWGTLLGMALTSTAFCAEQPKTRYLIQKNETLGEILYRFKITPVWGKNGSARKTWELNREVVRKEGDRIYPGTWIVLPISSTQLAEAQKIINEPKRKIASDPSPALEPQIQSPAQVESSTSSIENDVPQEFQASLGYRFTALTARDAANNSTAKLISSRDIDVSAAWIHHWTSDFSSFFKVDLRSIGFEPSSNPNKSLSGTSNTPIHFSLGAQSDIGSMFSLRYFVSYGQELFVRGVSSNIISVDSVSLLSGTLAADAKLYRRTRTTLGADASGTYLSSGSTDVYTVQSGQAYTLGLYLDQKYGDHDASSLRLDVSYFQRNQNSSVVNQTETGTYAGLTISLPVFERRQKEINK